MLKATDKDLGLRTYFLYVLLFQYAAEGLALSVPEGVEIKRIPLGKFKFPDSFQELFQVAGKKRVRFD